MTDSKKHSKLSPSSAARWARCAGSVAAESKYKDKTNSYAEEGTLAHDVAYRMVSGEPIEGLNVSNEMIDYCKKYESYINGITSEKWSLVLFEQKVNYDNIVSKEEYPVGTADCIIVSKDTLHVIDFKYGFGAVKAYENYQLLIYALGALNSYDLNHVTKIQLHIVQPRINNYDSWGLSRDDLFLWGGFFKYRAKEAIKVNAPRTPSEEACKWCKAKTGCYALLGLFDDVASLQKAETDMTDSDIRMVLDNSTVVKDYIESINEKAKKTLEEGGEVNGYKLVKGRRTNKLNHDAEEHFSKLYGDEVYKKTLLCTSKLREVVNDDNLINSFMVTTEGKPVLAKESDKREQITSMVWNKS